MLDHEIHSNQQDNIRSGSPYVILSLLQQYRDQTVSGRLKKHVCKRVLSIFTIYMKIRLQLLTVSDGDLKKSNKIDMRLFRDFINLKKHANGLLLWPVY